MRPLLPQHFLRQFPKRSVLAGVTKPLAIVRQPTFITSLLSIGLHGALAFALPQLLSGTSDDEVAEAIETDVVMLAPGDMAAFSERATSDPPPQSSSAAFTDLNGRSLPNLSRGETAEEPQESPEPTPSDSSSFGWGSASSSYDWSSGTASDSPPPQTEFDIYSYTTPNSSTSSTYDSVYDAAREEEFYRYWQRSQDVLDRLNQADAAGGTLGDYTGDIGGVYDRKLRDGDDATDGDGDGKDETGGGGFNSGQPYQDGLNARIRYSEWAIAVQNEKGLGDEALDPIFISVSIPVPRTDGALALVGVQGVAGLLVKPDGVPDYIYPLSTFPANELAKVLMMEFVLDGFEGCNIGKPSDRWTACGLDITFVEDTGLTEETTDDRETESGSQDGIDGEDSGQTGDSNDIDGGSEADGDGATDGAADETPPPTGDGVFPPNELVLLAQGYEPETPIAIALAEATPVYEVWREELTARLGGVPLGFHPEPLFLPYPEGIDVGEVDSQTAITALVGVAIGVDARPIPDASIVLRSTGSDVLDATALQYAETTPRNWYAENVNLSGERDTIVMFAISFVEPEVPIDDTPVEPEERVPVDGEPSGEPSEIETDATVPNESNEPAPNDLRPDRSIAGDSEADEEVDGESEGAIDPESDGEDRSDDEDAAREGDSTGEETVPQP